MTTATATTFRSDTDVAAKAPCCNAGPGTPTGHACSSAAEAAEPAHAALHVHHGSAVGPAAGRVRLTTAATLHCLTGCAIGEWLGLAIGVTLGLDPWLTMTLATLLGFASGYLLGLWPLVRRGARWGDAWRRLWLGETVSIATMEFAMNVTDFHVGGMNAQSIFDGAFWFGYAVAVPAGFLVAWRVNGWLLGLSIKQPCH